MQLEINQKIHARLGYGTAGLGALNSEREIIDLLEFAYSSGITHFDTSNAYGYGTMEEVCGKFITGKRDEITITSKFGLPIMLKSSADMDKLRVIRKALKSFKPLYSFGRKILRRKAPARSYVTKEMFSACLEDSLLKAKIDYFDYYMIHERDYNEINASEVYEAMQNMIDQGKIRNAGIAVSAQQLPYYNNSLLPNNFIVQTEGSLFGHHTQNNNKPMILQRIFCYNESEKKQFENAIQKYGSEYVRKAQIAWALMQSNNGICLFGSLSTKHILWNVNTCQDVVNSLPSELERMFNEIKR